MNWKQFLKPDWRKIVLTIILFVWFFFGLFVVGGEGDINPVFGIIGLIGMFASLPFVLIMFYLPIEDILGEWGWQILYFVLIGIYGYLLSCLIVWIYKKVKKK